MPNETQIAEDKPAPNGAPAVPKVKAAAGKPARKKATPKAAKAAKNPEPKAGPQRLYPDAAIVKVLKTEHGLRGHRGEALDALLKDGQTIERYKAVLSKKGGRMRTYFGWAVKTALEMKLVAVKA